MVDEDQIAEAGKRALYYFGERLNCAESVFKAIFDMVNTDLPGAVLAMMFGFGGGVGASGNVCWALSGGTAVLGLVYGRRNPLSLPVEERSRTYGKDGTPGLYRLFNQLPNRFKEKFGTVNCAELIKPWHIEAPERRERCNKIVSETASMAMRILLEAKTKGYDFDYGDLCIFPKDLVKR